MSSASTLFLVGYYGSSKILCWLSPMVCQMATEGALSKLSSWNHPGQGGGKILKSAICLQSSGRRCIDKIPFLKENRYDTYI